MKKIEAITAIVAGPGNDCDPAALRYPADGVGDGAARVFHEFDTWSATGNGQAVGLCHLGSREQFDHLPERVSARQTTDNSTQPIGSQEVLRGWLNSDHFA